MLGCQHVRHVGRQHHHEPHDRSGRHRPIKRCRCNLRCWQHGVRGTLHRRCYVLGRQCPRSAGRQHHDAALNSDRRDRLVQQRRSDVCWWCAHLRFVEHWRGAVLGIEHRWSARRWHHNQQPEAGRCHWPAEWNRFARRELCWNAHVRTLENRRDHLLGLRLLRRSQQFVQWRSSGQCREWLHLCAAFDAVSHVLGQVDDLF